MCRRIDVLSSIGGIFKQSDVLASKVLKKSLFCGWVVSKKFPVFEFYWSFFANVKFTILCT